MDDLIEELFDELKIELEIDLGTKDEDLLRLKIQNAYREVKYKMNYPKSYTEKQIEIDMECKRTIIKDVASFDYDAIGISHQKSTSEGGENRTFVDRDSLFKIVPFAN